MFKASIIIPTKDRVESLTRCLENLKKLSGYSELGIIVGDDGSKFNLKNKLQNVYPNIIFIRNDVSQGIRHQKNYLFKLASSEYVFCLDDDSWFIDNNAINTAVAIFNTNASAGILNFMVVWPDGSKTPRTSSQSSPYPIPSYIGCACAFRKSFFTDAPLYEGNYAFVRQGEEREHAIRCLDNGHDILQVNDIEVYHAYEQEGRAHQNIHGYAFRNELFCYMQLFPSPYWLFAVTTCLFSHALFCLRRGWFRAYFWGILHFVKDASAIKKLRKPVKRSTIIKYYRLRLMAPK